MDDKTTDSRHSTDSAPQADASRPPRTGMQGDAQFVACFARDSQRIFRYIFTLLPNRADAEDVFQQTSLILWQEFHKFDHDRDFAAWACGVAYNTVRNFIRVSGRRRLTFSDELLKIMADERTQHRRRSDERVSVLDTCIGKLRQHDRELVDQVYGGGAAVREVAESLGHAVQTLYNRLNRIRRELVECVDRHASVRQRQQAQG